MGWAERYEVLSSSRNRCQALVKEYGNAERKAIIAECGKTKWKTMSWMERYEALHKTDGGDGGGGDGDDGGDGDNNGSSTNGGEQRIGNTSSSTNDDGGAPNQNDRCPFVPASGCGVLPSPQQDDSATATGCSPEDITEQLVPQEEKTHQKDQEKDQEEQQEEQQTQESQAEAQTEAQTEAQHALPTKSLDGLPCLRTWGIKSNDLYYLSKLNLKEKKATGMYMTRRNNEIHHAILEEEQHNTLGCTGQGSGRLTDQMKHIGQQYQKSLSVLFKSYSHWNSSRSPKANSTSTFDAISKQTGTLDVTGFLNLCRHFRLTLKKIQLPPANIEDVWTRTTTSPCDHLCLETNKNIKYHERLCTIEHLEKDVLPVLSTATVDGGMLATPGTPGSLIGSVCSTPGSPGSPPGSSSPGHSVLPGNVEDLHSSIAILRSQTASSVNSLFLDIFVLLGTRT